MTEQFKLNFNEEEKGDVFDREAQSFETSKTIFLGILERMRAHKPDSKREFISFIDIYKNNEPGLIKIVEVYNAWLKENNKSERYVVESEEDRFGHTKYVIVESGEDSLAA